MDYFLASGIAGTVATMYTMPIWVLKTRILSSDKGTVGAYANMWHGARQIMRTEGLRGFYKGTTMSMLGISTGAIQFAIYEPMKNTWRNYVAKESPDSGDIKMSVPAMLTISSTAKIVSSTITYPLQVIRSRLQTYHAEETFGKGVRGVARNVWIEDGWKGYYRGLGTNIIRVMPATWVTFVVYEKMRYYLPLWGIGTEQEAPDTP